MAYRWRAVGGPAMYTIWAVVDYFSVLLSCVLHVFFYPTFRPRYRDTYLSTLKYGAHIFVFRVAMKHYSYFHLVFSHIRRVGSIYFIT